jgi:biotin transport system substrate-specific component
MALYLLVGALGYGVFAGEVADVPQAFGATTGYLIGFLAAQPVIGCIARHSQRSWAGLAAAILAGSAVIFLCGLSWLAFSTGASLSVTLAMGLYPYLPGLVLKTWLAISAGRIMHPLARRWFDRSL